MRKLRLLDKIEVGLDESFDKEGQSLAPRVCSRHRSEDEEVGMGALPPGECIVLA